MAVTAGLEKTVMEDPSNLGPLLRAMSDGDTVMFDGLVRFYEITWKRRVESGMRSGGLLDETRSQTRQYEGIISITRKLNPNAINGNELYIEVRREKSDVRPYLTEITGAFNNGWWTAGAGDAVEVAVPSNVATHLQVYGRPIIKVPEEQSKL